MNLSALTKREREVLRRRATGRPYKTVASELGISLSTTKHHLSSIFKKLRVSSSLEAVKFL